MIACYVESANGVRWERGYKIGWPGQASGLDLSLSVMAWIAYCVGSDVGRVSSQSPPYCTQNTGIQQSPQKKLWRHPRSSALLSNWLKSRSHHIIIRVFTQVNIARCKMAILTKNLDILENISTCVVWFLFTSMPLLLKAGPHMIQDHDHLQKIV